MKVLREPLELSAPLAWRLAPQLCRKNPVTGENCAWNHGFWQCLRVMELAVTPAYQAEFYHRALQSVAGGSGVPRVLISGTADYSMLAHVLAIYRERGLEPGVTVVDICETPLYLNRWYAQRESARITCSRCDILDFVDGAPFDVVCTDSFLGQFATEHRGGLFAKWWQLLRPGGTVITVTRVRATADTAQIGFSPEQARAVRDAVMLNAESMCALLDEDAAEIALAADAYVHKQRTWPVRTHEEVCETFERCGFRVDELSEAPDVVGNQPLRKNPASPGSGKQVRIIATRL